MSMQEEFRLFFIVSGAASCLEVCAELRSRPQACGDADSKESDILPRLPYRRKPVTNMLSCTRRECICPLSTVVVAPLFEKREKQPKETGFPREKETRELSVLIVEIWQ